MKLFLICFSFFSAVSFAEIDWDMAAKEIKYLRPHAFKELSGKKIDRAYPNCEIPQSYSSSQPHNAVRGSFAEKGSKDWAVLCSKNGKSSIVIVWEKGKPCPSEIELKKDKDLLQQIGEKEVGFSRFISSADKNIIIAHQKNYGGPLPAKIEHEGIDDAFLGKGSTTFYCENGKWLRLTGSD